MRNWKMFGVLFGVLALGSNLAHAQSSKFAATYDTDARMVDVEVNGGSPSCILADPTPEAPASGDEYTFCSASDGPTAEAELAKLHVANWKEILGTLSAQVNLVTFTQAKGKNGGGTSTAVAEGTVRAGMLVVPEGSFDAGSCRAAFDLYDLPKDNPQRANVFAAPGPVTFASRRQELSVTTDLDVIGSLEGCNEQCIADSLGIDGSVTVALGLDTTAAHSFQFIADDLDSGSYDVVACYDLSALAEVSGLDIDADTAAHSKVALGPRIITAQEVRATKDGIIDESGSVQ